MNKLAAVITGIHSSENISLVDLEAHGVTLSCVIIETARTAGYLRLGNQVTLLFKETEVALARDFQGEISLRNRLASTVKQVERGTVLAKVTLDFHGEEIVAIITSRSADQLALAPGMAVVGLVKANEVTIMATEAQWDSTGNR